MSNDGTDEQKRRARRRVSDALEQAYTAVSPNEDGSRDNKKLLDALGKILPFDSEAARLRDLKKIIADHQKPGATEPDGQLAIPGLEAFSYEPDRLIDNGQGQVIKQHNARPEFKSAEAARAQRNLDRVHTWAQRKNRENSAFAQWAIEEITRRQRPVTELTFGNFVKEANWWRPGEAPTEPDYE